MIMEDSKETQAEETQAEEPQAEEPQAEEPQAEEPQAEEPQAEEPQAEEPQAEKNIHKKLNEAYQKNESIQNKYLRALADIENLRKRSIRERKNLLQGLALNCFPTCYLFWTLLIWD